MEMDARSPRLRLSVVGYLLDAKAIPLDLELVDEIVQYVSKDTAAYADDVAAIQDPEEEKEEPNQTKSAYDILGEGYL